MEIERHPTQKTGRTSLWRWLSERALSSLFDIVLLLHPPRMHGHALYGVDDSWSHLASSEKKLG